MALSQAGAIAMFMSGFVAKTGLDPDEATVTIRPVPNLER